CLADMLSIGYSPLLSTLAGLSGGYAGLLSLRYDLMSRLTRASFGIVYIGLPTLGYVGFYSAIRTKRPSWALLATLAGIATAWLSVAIAQKSIILVFLIVLAIGAYLLGVVRLWSLGIVAGGLLGVLTLMQAFAV